MARILIVDDEPDLRDMLSQMLALEGHACDQAASGLEGCRQVMDGTGDYDLIITDIKMPEMGGLEFLREIRPAVESRTPCIIITGYGDDRAYVEALRVGACDFLHKPFDLKDIRAAVEHALDLRRLYRFRRDYKKHLEQALREKEAELKRTYDGILSAIASMMESKDGSTSEHCLRVSDYCRELADAMGVPPDRIRDVELGAMLHDIGKFKIPDHILKKPGPLTEEEWTVMRRHPAYGAEVARRIPFLAGAVAIIESHHERYDGTGYPYGRAGEEIPLEARIFAVVDAFDAITQDRCYSEARSTGAAIEELRSGRGAQFDPRVVEAFERILPRILRIQANGRASVEPGGVGGNGRDEDRASRRSRAGSRPEALAPPPRDGGRSDPASQRAAAREP